MVELVDTTDLKSVDPKGRAGSSPAPGTKREIAAMRSPVFGYLQDVKMTPSFLTILLRSLCVGFALMLISGCEPVQEQILGTYLLDADRGCSSCQATGPERMVFADDDISDGIPGAYRFEFADGELHSGTYDFLQVDTVIAVILYPDSASSEFALLVGETIRTDYRIRRNAVKERCNGVFRDCVWNRLD